MASRMSLCCFAFLALHSSSLAQVVVAGASESDAKEFVVALDHSNFMDFVSKHDFIIVSFYTPGCGHCQALAPEYEKAAYVLSGHNPPLTLAEVDIGDEANTGLAGSDGTISIKILREGGKRVQQYKGPYDADGIVKYVKRQYGPASVEVNTPEDAKKIFSDKKIVIVGIFPQFSGEEFKNYTLLAQKLRPEEEFFHTSDAKLLPRGNGGFSPTLIPYISSPDISQSAAKCDFLRKLDFQDFDADALEKFVEKSSVPTVTIFNADPSNQRFADKFMSNANSKVMLFTDFGSNIAASFNSKYHEVADQNKGDSLSFLMGDISASTNAITHFGLKDDQLPLIIIQNNDGTKYLKSNVEPDQISPWVKKYKNGELQPYIKSEPIPEHDDEPMKVVVARTFQDIVFNSGKNVLLEFYSPWSKQCKELASIFDEVAISYKSDPDVIIAKFDAVANDFPRDTQFEVRGYPAVYFKPATGSILQYTGYATKEDFRNFIENNRSKAADKDSEAKDEL